MIKICERCFHPIDLDEEFVHYGHIAHADLQGNVEWAYTYSHTPRVQTCLPVPSMITEDAV